MTIILNKSLKEIKNKWSGRKDSNLRPPGPKPGALPGCATPRELLVIVINLLKTIICLNI